MKRRYARLILVGALLCCSGQNAFCEGVAKAALAKDGRCASFVPINMRAYRLCQPDGVTRLFVRDDEEPNLLHGDNGWMAEIDGRRALIMKDASAPSGRRGFMAIDGFIRKQLVGTRESDVVLPPPGTNSSALASLWPEKGKRLVAAEPPDIWSGGNRLKLWFGNPNKAGLLLAELSLAFLALLFLRSVWWRILGVLLSLAAFIGLMQTSSRGALLGFLFGLATMGLLRAKSLFSWKRILVALGVIAVFVGCFLCSGQVDRLGRNLLNEGQRETSRLTIWKEVPRMMLDAPGGWGYGQAAHAYIDWYQPESECLLKDLISGHLTFLVESSWPVRLCYVFLWLAVMLVGLGQAIKGAAPVPLAVLMAFAVAGCFNPVVAVPELWIAPMFAAMWILLLQTMPRGGSRSFRIDARTLLLCLAVGTAMTELLLCATAALAGMSKTKVPVRKCGNVVLVNGTAPDVWLVDDDYVLHGGYWWLKGQEIRRYFQEHSGLGTLGYVRSVNDLPREAEKIVLVGEKGREFLEMACRPSVKQLVFISPPFHWRSIPTALSTESNVSFVMGAHAARLVAGREKPKAWVRIIPGAELYFPTWLDFVL